MAELQQQQAEVKQAMDDIIALKAEISSFPRTRKSYLAPGVADRVAAAKAKLSSSMQILAKHTPPDIGMGVSDMGNDSLAFMVGGDYGGTMYDGEIITDFMKNPDLNITRMTQAADSLLGKSTLIDTRLTSAADSVAAAEAKGESLSKDQVDILKSSAGTETLAKSFGMLADKFEELLPEYTTIEDFIANNDEIQDLYSLDDDFKAAFDTAIDNSKVDRDAFREASKKANSAFTKDEKALKRQRTDTAKKYKDLGGKISAIASDRIETETDALSAYKDERDAEGGAFNIKDMAKSSSDVLDKLTGEDTGLGVSGIDDALKGLDPITKDKGLLDQLTAGSGDLKNIIEGEGGYNDKIQALINSQKPGAGELSVEDQIKALAGKVAPSEADLSDIKSAGNVSDLNKLAISASKNNSALLKAATASEDLNRLASLAEPNQTDIDSITDSASGTSKDLLDLANNLSGEDNLADNLTNNLTTGAGNFATNINSALAPVTTAANNAATAYKGLGSDANAIGGLAGDIGALGNRAIGSTDAASASLGSLDDDFKSLYGKYNALDSLRNDTSSTFAKLAGNANTAELDALRRLGTQDNALAALEGRIPGAYQDTINDFQGIRDNASSRFSNLSNAAGATGQGQFDRFSNLANEVRDSQGVASGQYSDVRNQYQGILDQQDPRFEQFRQAQLNELGNQEQDQISQIQAQFAAQGLSGSSQEANALQNVRESIGRQRGSLTAQIGMQQLGRQDNALSALGSLTGTQADLDSRMINQRSGLYGSGFDAVRASQGVQGDLLSKDIANTSNIAGIQGGLRTGEIAASADLSARRSDLANNMANVSNQFIGQRGGLATTGTQLNADLLDRGVSGQRDIAGARAGLATTGADLDLKGLNAKANYTGQEISGRSAAFDMNKGLIGSGLNATAMGADAKARGLSAGYNATSAADTSALNALFTKTGMNADLLRSADSVNRSGVMDATSMKNMGLNTAANMFGNAATSDLNALSASDSSNLNSANTAANIYGNAGNIDINRLTAAADMNRRGSIDAGNLLSMSADAGMRGTASAADLLGRQLDASRAGISDNRNAVNNDISARMNIAGMNMNAAGAKTDIYNNANANDLSNRMNLSDRYSNQVRGDIADTRGVDDRYLGMLGNAAGASGTATDILSRGLDNDISRFYGRAGSNLDLGRAADAGAISAYDNLAGYQRDLYSGATNAGAGRIANPYLDSILSAYGSYVNAAQLPAMLQQ